MRISKATSLLKPSSNACSAGGTVGLYITGVATTRPAVADWARAAGLDAAGAYAELAVSDDGTGIDADELPRVFEPFYTTKEVGRGTGLGLAIAYGVMKQHRGAISVARSRSPRSKSSMASTPTYSWRSRKWRTCSSASAWRPGDTSAAEVGEIEPVLAAYPELPLVLAHAGHPGTARTLELMARYPRLYADLTPVWDRHVAVEAEDLARFPDRFLFGSDAPNSPLPRSGQQQRIERMGLPAPVLESILGGAAPIDVPVDQRAAPDGSGGANWQMLSPVTAEIRFRGDLFTNSRKMSRFLWVTRWWLLAFACPEKVVLHSRHW